jgi:hypothetical protein
MKLGTSFYWEEKGKTTYMSSSSDPASNPSKEEKKPVEKLQNTQDPARVDISLHYPNR